MDTDDSRSHTELLQQIPFTGPCTLAGRYLRSFWQPVFRTRDLPPGRALAIRIMSEDFTLYRGQGGSAHLVAFRCAHREAQLSVGSVEGDCIRCFYHGWKYDSWGQCVEQPAEIEPFAGKVRIRSYPVREQLGLIFAYLGEGEAPELPRFPDFEEPGVSVDVDTQTYLRRSNYFQKLENTIDSTHLGFVHRNQRFTFDGIAETPTLSARESAWGLTLTITRPTGQKQQVEFGMPNTSNINSFSRVPGLERIQNLFWAVPIDDECHMQFGVGRIPLTGEAADEYFELESARRAKIDMDHNEVAAAILSGKMTWDDVDAERTDLVLAQDDVAQRSQGVIQARSSERLGRGDAGIILLRKLWVRELRNVREGRPLTQWERPVGMRPYAWTDHLPEAATAGVTA